MSRFPKFALAAIVAAVASSSLASAATVAVSTSAAEVAAVKIGEGRLRWGGTGFEVGAGSAVGVSGQFSNINYAGTSWPSSTFTFALNWDAALGRISLSTSRSSAVATFDIASAIGSGPQDLFIRIGANATQTVTLSDLKVNGTAVSGSVPSLVSTAANTFSYHKISGLTGTSFTSLTGSFSFTGVSNFSSERPLINLSLANPTSRDLAATAIPLPSASLAGAAALATGLTRRTRRA